MKLTQQRRTQYAATNDDPRGFSDEGCAQPSVIHFDDVCLPPWETTRSRMNRRCASLKGKRPISPTCHRRMPSLLPNLQWNLSSMNSSNHNANVCKWKSGMASPISRLGKIVSLSNPRCRNGFPAKTLVISPSSSPEPIFKWIVNNPLFHPQSSFYSFTFLFVH